MGGSPTLQTRYVTPSASTQYINPQTGYDGLNQCVVYGDSNLVSGNIKSRVSIFGVNRSYSGTTITKEYIDLLDYQNNPPRWVTTNLGTKLEIQTYNQAFSNIDPNKIVAIGFFKLLFGFQSWGDGYTQLDAFCYYPAQKNTTYSYLRFGGNLPTYNSKNFTSGRSIYCSDDNNISKSSHITFSCYLDYSTKKLYLPTSGYTLRPTSTVEEEANQFGGSIYIWTSNQIVTPIS